ncbi:MAG: hypothetical protein ITG02_00805 [Patulibacter sp.]|nr:hypothetical protein [Patulibacter sp.]
MTVHAQGLYESQNAGGGTRVWASAHGARVGKDCTVCNGAFVGGGAVVGDHVMVKNHVAVRDGPKIEGDRFIGSTVVFTNDDVPRAHVKRGADEFVSPVCRGATVGALAPAVCGEALGEHSFVAAGGIVDQIARIGERAVV